MTGPGRHRPPPRLPRLGILAAVGGLVMAAALIAITGPALAPDGRATHTAALPPSEVSEPIARGGPMGPLAAPTIGAPGPWEESKGPVIVDGRPLPAVRPASAPTPTTAPVSSAARQPDPVAPPAPDLPVQAAEPPPETPVDPAPPPPPTEPTDPIPVPDPPADPAPPIIIDGPAPELTP